MKIYLDRATGRIHIEVWDAHLVTDTNGEGLWWLGHREAIELFSPEEFQPLQRGDWRKWIKRFFEKKFSDVTLTG